MSEIQTIDQKRVTPRAGILVPLPDGNGNLPPEGKDVTLDSYWYQRKFDGDVTIEDMVHATDVVPLSELGSPKARNK
jgi:hypothetical protein